MAEVISISVEGEAQVKSALAKVEKDIVDRLPLNKDLSDELSRQASARAPRLTGELASTGSTDLFINISTYFYVILG